ncbi:unnamed protein product [Boreogadus saida]
MERRWDELKKAPRDEAVSSVNQLEEPPDRAFWLLTWRESCPSRRSWCTALVALVCVMWSFCQVEAPLHPSLGLAEVAWRILCSGCLLAGLGACAMLLKKSLGRSGKAMVLCSESVADQKNTHFSWVSKEPSLPGGGVSLARALTDSLLLCVLQEPLSHPTLPHVEALLARLKRVSRTLQGAEGLPAAGSDCEALALVERVKALNTYLQQRTRTLGGLVRAQGEFEADMEGLLGVCGSSGPSWRSSTPGSRSPRTGARARGIWPAPRLRQRYPSGTVERGGREGPGGRLRSLLSSVERLCWFITGRRP